MVGRDIKSYQPLTPERFVILIPNGWTQNESKNSSDPWGWFSKRYPAIASHLAGYADAAQRRTDMGQFWWELRPCDYYNEFERPKIVYAEIATRGQFTLDEDNLYCDMTGFIIGTDSKYLLGLLNSTLWTFMFSKTSSEIRGGFLRWKRQYMSPLPIRPINFSNPKEVASHDRVVQHVEALLVLHRQRAEATPNTNTYDEIEREIAAEDSALDGIVYQLYGLTEEEIAIVEGR